ncbi:hypothetical protein WJX72_003692 [[Myrmecia] bisecta]|uniref:Glycosyltransferase family 61 protein n=1 Tax=[Myrmecia] bisecta TaxID=41462 RepID=A0AAW1PA45_9CHLO
MQSKQLCTTAFDIRQQRSVCLLAQLYLIQVTEADVGQTGVTNSAQQQSADWFYEDFPGGTVGGTTMTSGGLGYKVYHNLWYQNERYFAVEDNATLHDPSAAPLKTELTINMWTMRLPVTSAPLYYQNLKTGWVRGTTLIVDFPFAAFPDNMGHWAEVLLPAYSVLSQGAWKHSVRNGTGFVDSLLLVNLRRAQLQGVHWVWAMLKLTVEPALPPGLEMPRLLFYDELEVLDKAMWLGFQNALVINDRYVHEHGKGGFASTELGQRFRERAYAASGVQQPQPWQLGGAPRTITLLTAVGGEQVENRGALTAALQDIGIALGMKVRPFSITTGASFPSYVAAMARTGVLISRHGPLLANTMFLPPGAVVLELLPYNWEWRGVSEIYVNITRSIGDIHHFAWRAKHPRWAAYYDVDEARYADWTAEECSSRHCLEVHARAGMMADAATIQELLLDVLPAVYRGENVSALAQPWPKGAVKSGNTGLWWDK